ncbi:MAG: Rrf2 family transcriptional regulator [Acidobacteriota bacterium]
MRISLKAEYAVRALLDLALHAPRNMGSRSAEVARRTGVPGKFLDAILRDLRKAGLVSSRRGRDGGHWLARDPSRLTVRAILEAIDGPLSAGFAREHRGSASSDVCLQDLWGRVVQAVEAVVDDVTLDDLRRQAGNHDPLDFTI